MMILVVDDDADVRELVRSALEGSGYSVQEADSGQAALQMLENEHPCLILLDLVMPDLDGWEVVEQLKARSIDHVPVCVVSALTEKAPPGVTTLRKPFTLKELLAVAGKYCTPEHHDVGG